MVDVVEYICCCGDVAVVEMRVTQHNITENYISKASGQQS